MMFGSMRGENVAVWFQNGFQLQLPEQFSPDTLELCLKFRKEKKQQLAIDSN